MEVRCGKCNKLFRVSDDKITGSGIKFACSRCGEYVKITRADFEQYNLSQVTASVPASHEPKPETAKTSPKIKDQLGSAPAAPAPSFDVGKLPANELPPEDQAPPAFVKPAPAPGPAPAPVQPKPQSKVEPKESKPAAHVMQHTMTSPKPAAASKPESTAIPSSQSSMASSAPAGEAAHPAMPLSSLPSAAPVASSGRGKKLPVIIAVLLVIMIAAVFGAKWYLGRASQHVSDAVKAVTTPEGLLITSSSGVIDPANQDLVITGVIENTTDKPRAAWYVVAEVYDAQNTVLVRAKMLSGKQIYTRRDYDILTRRGHNIQDLKMKMQEPGIGIRPKSTVNFEIRIMEPPVGIASFNATLQPFDPVQLFKEIVEDQKQ
jgi:zinc ribbon protein/uncharacterized protein DUF3426